jgi:hypothetical protein
MRSARSSPGLPRDSAARIRDRMGLVAATSAALCLWIVLWSLGAKAIDGMMLALTIIIVAAGISIVSRYLFGHQRQ